MVGRQHRALLQSMPLSLCLGCYPNVTSLNYSPRHSFSSCRHLGPRLEAALHENPLQEDSPQFAEKITNLIHEVFIQLDKELADHTGFYKEGNVSFLYAQSLAANLLFNPPARNSAFLLSHPARARLWLHDTRLAGHCEALGVHEFG